MTKETEERIKREAGDYSSSQRVMGEIATAGYKGYISGATSESKRSEELGKEIERLKELIERAFDVGYTQGHHTGRYFPNKPEWTKNWQQFKTENNL